MRNTNKNNSQEGLKTFLFVTMNLSAKSLKISC